MTQYQKGKAIKIFFYLLYRMTYDGILGEGIKRAAPLSCSENLGEQGVKNTLVLKPPPLPPPLIDLPLASNKTVPLSKHVRNLSRSSLSSKPSTKRVVSTLSSTTSSSTGRKAAVEDHKQYIFEIHWTTTRLTLCLSIRATSHST